MIFNSLTKAKLVFEDGTEIECQFNPSDLSISKSNTWKTLPSTGRSTPPAARFVCGGPSSLTLDLTLDSTDTGDPVTNKTNKLQTLVEIDESSDDYDSSNSTGRPPWVKLVWGDMVPFKCICTSLTITFTYFGTNGDPLRAKAQISLQQFNDPDNPPAQNPTSGTPRPHKLHTVSPGETLDRIAAKHYGAAGKWRLIADANAGVVFDPLGLRPGTVLLIPDKRRPRDG